MEGLVKISEVVLLAFSALVLGRLLLSWARKRWLSAHFDDDDRPRKCWVCGANELDIEVEVHLQGAAAEYAVTCKRCHTELGYFVYGTYDPHYRERAKAMWLKALLQRWRRRRRAY